LVFFSSPQVYNMKKRVCVSATLIRKYVDGTAVPNDFILIHPTGIITSTDIRQRRSTNDKRIEWYENGHMPHSVVINDWTEEQIENLKQQIESNDTHTKLDQVYMIKRCDIDKRVMRAYRFVQPVVQFPTQSVPIEPYYIGVWLGDGTARNTQITNIERSVLTYLRQFSERYEIEYVERCAKLRKTKAKDHETCHTMTIALNGGKFRPIPLTPMDIIIREYLAYLETTGKKATSFVQSGQFSQLIENTTFTEKQIIGRLRVVQYKKQKGLWVDDKHYTLLDEMRNLQLIPPSQKKFDGSQKHIPDVYLKNSIEVRSQLLAGLIDTDGYNTKNGYEITQKNKTLSENIVTLAQSLGYYTTMKETRKSCTYKGDRRWGTYHRIILRPTVQAVVLPVLCQRKKLNGTTPGPKFDKDGNILQRQKKAWTEESRDELQRALQNYHGGRISWKRVQENHPLLAHFSTSALRAQARHTAHTRL